MQTAPTEPLLPDLSAEFAGIIGGTLAERVTRLVTMRDKVRTYVAEVAGFQAAMVAERQRVLEVTEAKLAELSAAQAAAADVLATLDEVVRGAREALALALYPADPTAMH